MLRNMRALLRKQDFQAGQYGGNDKNDARHEGMLYNAMPMYTPSLATARKQENILSPSKNIYAVLQYFDECFVKIFRLQHNCSKKRSQFSIWDTKEGLVV